jgi:hypothetical protein
MSHFTLTGMSGTPRTVQVSCLKNMLSLPSIHCGLALPSPLGAVTHMLPDTTLMAFILCAHAALLVCFVPKQAAIVAPAFAHV